LLGRLADDDRFDIRPMSAFDEVDVVRGVIDTDSPLPDGYVELLAKTVTLVGRYDEFALSEGEIAMTRIGLARARGTAGAWTMLMHNLGRVREPVEAAFDRVSVAEGTVTFASSRGSSMATQFGCSAVPRRTVDSISW
jgi:hypothetical protein